MESLRELFSKYKKEILERMPFVEVEHVGGSAVPGIDTKGDLDIQIRVDNINFINGVSICEELFSRRHEEIWTDEFALFGDPKQEIKVDIMLTVKESAYDNFFRIRDAFMADPNLRERYSNLKKKYPDYLSDEYRRAKHIFFRELEAELGMKVRPISNFPR